MKTSITLGLIALTISGAQLQAEDCFFNSCQAGFRVGFDAENTVSLNSYEIFSTIDSPWSWELSDSITADINFEAALGALTGEGETAGYIRFAPALEISFGDFPVSVVMSSGPSLYSEDTFDQYDMGGNFHFTSSIGLEWEMCENWSLNYRFQHTSNADINDPNPGLDMHTVGLVWKY